MKAEFISYENFISLSEEEMLSASAEFYTKMKRRRTVRDFSDKAVPEEVIKNCILTAGLAPNGANLQPWHFVVVKDPEIKKQIKMGAEEEEKAFYNGKAPQEWIDALEHLGTDDQKPFLEIAPYLICIFAKSYDLLPDGKKRKHYYVQESVGIATGMLITALHEAGLVSLTHTPSPMAFLNKILDRPSNERPYMILVAGYPAENVTVPKISKMEVDELISWK